MNTRYAPGIMALLVSCLALALGTQVSAATPTSQPQDSADPTSTPPPVAPPPPPADTSTPPPAIALPPPPERIPDPVVEQPLPQVQDVAARPQGPLVFIDPSGYQVTPDQLRRFLLKFRSPLADHADRLVQVGVRHGVDPRLIVAIAGVESTFGKRCRGHNAWGWGRARWKSWEEGIDSYGQKFGSKYHPTFDTLDRVARRYNPRGARRWSAKVRHFYGQI